MKQINFYTYCILLSLLLFAFNTSYNKTNGSPLNEEFHAEASLSNYEKVLSYMDSLVEVAEKMRIRSELTRYSDSVFCDKIIKHIEQLQNHIEAEINLMDKQLYEKVGIIEDLDIERTRITKYFLIAVAVLSIGMLFLMYSRYRITSNARRILEEKQKDCVNANKQLEAKNAELTEHKEKLEKLNMELNLTNKKLRNSEKELMATNFSKDKFFSIISHDLRNPFAAIVSFSRIIKRDIDSLSKEELKELAVELDKSVLKINTLLDNLLIWSRSQSGKTRFQPRYVNLYEVIYEISELFEGNIKEKEVEIIINIDDDLVVYGDRDMLETIIRNLLTNAIKYSNKGGKIIFSAQTDSSHAQISIADEGVGIPEEDKEKIFDPNLFFTTYGTGDEKGSGLGLLITKEFVDKHGGEISFESKEGKGSVFTFKVPLEEV